MNDDEIWQSFDVETSWIKGECAEIEGQGGNDECDAEYRCDKHEQQYLAAVATAFRKDERAKLMSLFDDVVASIPDDKKRDYIDGINDLAVWFKQAIKEERGI